MLQLSVNESTESGAEMAVLAKMNFEQTFQSDLHLAVAVQRHMLPRNTKQLSTISYAGISAAARGIGGDYYDFLDLGPGSLGFVLADASGKGVAAALLIANLQATIRSESGHAPHDLAAALERVNRHFFESTLPEQFATLFFGRYDEATGRLAYVNCGHQPAILRRANGRIERLEATALPLGLIPDWTGETKSIELRAGDELYVCSDGVTEAGIHRGCEFGEAGLISVIAASPGGDIPSALARITRAMHSYAPAGLNDDATVVGLRVLDRENS